MAAVAAVALVTVQQTVTLGGDLLGQALSNSAHIPLFAVLTLLLHHVLGRPHWYGLLLVALLLAVATEALQMLTDRHPSLFDVGLDVLGIVPVIVALQLSRRQRGRRRWRHGAWWAAGALVLLMTAVAPLRVLSLYAERDASFPRLLIPGTAPGSLLSSNGSMRVIPAPAGWLDYAGRDVLEVVWAPLRYPGVSLTEVVPDWSAFTALVVDVYLPDGPAMPLTAAVGHLGTPGTARYQRRLIEPGGRRLRYDLSVLLEPRDSDPVRVTRLILHSDQANAGRRLLIGEARLVRAAEREAAFTGTLARRADEEGSCR